jgi:adenine phosphoribosyltransferase
MNEIRDAIRDIPDFPKPGIIFKDITPILKDPRLFGRTLDIFKERYGGGGITAIAAIESRGFIFGGAFSRILNVPFIPVRKSGKLPHKTVSATYELEYGTDTIEMHADALGAGDAVLIMDDLVATGGTAKATAELVEKVGAKVVEMAFVIELAFLNPREKLEGYDVFSIVRFE